MNKLYALDFDGVICDSAVETAVTGWKAAQKIWQDMPDLLPEKQLINDFRQVRPFLETGYEAILIMRRLYQKVSVQTLCSNYEAEMLQLIQENQLQLSQLKQLFGETRDRWIKTAPQEWLSMNPLFNGITKHLNTLSNSTWYIITTKQQRFVTQILQANGIKINQQNIYGMERQQSKQEILLQLQQQHPKQVIVFVEDRLPTLVDIQKVDALQQVQLQLATWGYNSSADKAKAQACDIEQVDLSMLLNQKKGSSF